MRIEQFLYFLEIAQTQSIHIAAENLYISQPAVSRSIRALEDELGIQLFKRTVEGACLTENGRKLYPEIKKIVEKISDLQAHAHALAMEDAEFNKMMRLNVLTVSTLVDTWFLPAIEMLQKQYLYVQPILKNLKLTSFSERVLLEEKQDIDLVVATDINDILSPVFIANSWKKEVLFYEEYAAVVGDAHPLAKKNEIILKEAFAYPVIAPQNGLPTTELFQILMNIDEPPSVFLQSNNVSTIFPVLQHNMGVLLTTNSLAEKDFVNFQKVKIIPIKNLRGVCFALYDPKQPVYPIIRDLLNYLKYSRLK